MLLEAEPLPHLICSRPMFIGGVRDEADQHGGAGRVGSSDSGTVFAGGQDRAGPHPRRVHGDYRLSPQARDAAASGGSAEAAFWTAARAPGLRGRDTGSTDRALGGLGPDLRQAAAAAGARSGRGNGAAWPSSARAGGAHQPAGDERGHDRALRDVRQQAGRSTRRKAPPSAAIRRSVPVRTFDGWDNPPPGFVEADLVAHSGPVTKGSFVQTLVLTDIATGWTECAPLLVREQRLLTEVLSEMRKLLPFALLGLDTDNDSVFMNDTVRDYCLAAGVEFTRCRPYRKNDQAWVEQK